MDYVVREEVASSDHVACGTVVKNPPAMQETQVQYRGLEDPLEEGMATHSSTLVWKIPWTEDLVCYSSRGHKKSDTI